MPNVSGRASQVVSRYQSEVSHIHIFDTTGNSSWSILFWSRTLSSRATLLNTWETGMSCSPHQRLSRLETLKAYLVLKRRHCFVGVLFRLLNNPDGSQSADGTVSVWASERSIGNLIRAGTASVARPSVKSLKTNGNKGDMESASSVFAQPRQ